jgi:FkbM family methyltransferase
MTEYQATLSGLFKAGAFLCDSFDIERCFRGRKLVVYGAGESFHYFKEIVMRQYGYIPSVVLDKKFSGHDTFEGIPSFSPLEFNPTMDEMENALVVICLGNQPYFDEILDTLQKMGFRHIISLMDIYEIHNPFHGPRALMETGFQYFIDQRERIESCMAILEDNESREVFIRCLQTHMQRKPVAIPMRDRQEQYTPQDIQLCRGYSRFIYCGVSVGEMAGVFKRVGKIDELVCFEPDPNQFGLLTDYLSMHREKIAERVTAVPCAVYRHESVEPFTYSDTSFGSRILASGDARVQCVSIDNVIPGFFPTFINMDIEGAELEALKGAERTIRESRPDLAICTYHCPSHLWEIPLYLDGLGLGYRFYLRNYTSFVGETVLYATI